MWPRQAGEIQAGGDEVFDLATIEVGSLYLVRARVRPVHLRQVANGWLLADPRWQHRIGRIGAVSPNQIGIDKVDLTIAVDVAERNVGHGCREARRIDAVHGHKQRIHHIDAPLAIHIPQQAAPHQPLAARWRSHRYFHRSHARLDRKGRVHIRRQPRTPHRQPIDRRTLPQRPLRHRPPRTPRNRRPTGLPIDQHHLPGQQRVAAAEPIEIDARPHGLPRRIRRVPHRRVEPTRPFSIHQRRYALPQHIEHLQAHMGSNRQLIGNNRGGIERIGIVRPQGKAVRQCTPSKAAKGKSPGRIGRGAGDGPGPQIGQIEQGHLGPGHRLPIRQPHPACDHRPLGRTRLNEAQQRHQPEHSFHDVVRAAPKSIGTVVWVLRRSNHCNLLASVMRRPIRVSMEKTVSRLASITYTKITTDATYSYRQKPLFMPSKFPRASLQRRNSFSSSDRVFGPLRYPV